MIPQIGQRIVRHLDQIDSIRSDLEKIDKDHAKFLESFFHHDAYRAQAKYFNAQLQLQNRIFGKKTVRKDIASYPLSPPRITLDARDPTRPVVRYLFQEHVRDAARPEFAFAELSYEFGYELNLKEGSCKPWAPLVTLEELEDNIEDHGMSNTIIKPDYFQ